MPILSTHTHTHLLTLFNLLLNIMYLFFYTFYFPFSLYLSFSSFFFHIFLLFYSSYYIPCPNDFSTLDCCQKRSQRYKRYSYGRFETYQVGYPAGLAEAREERSVDSSGVVADSVLSAEEDAWRVLHHVVPFAGVARNHWCRQIVIVIARGACTEYM